MLGADHADTLTTMHKLALAYQQAGRLQEAEQAAALYAEWFGRQNFFLELQHNLVYGDDDWSRPAEREANAHAIPGVRTATLTNSGHFSSREKPHEVAQLINELV